MGMLILITQRTNDDLTVATVKVGGSWRVRIPVEVLARVQRLPDCRQHGVPSLTSPLVRLASYQSFGSPNGLRERLGRGRRLEISLVAHSVPGELKRYQSVDTLAQSIAGPGEIRERCARYPSSRHFVLGFTLYGSLMQLWEIRQAWGNRTCTVRNPEIRQTNAWLYYPHVLPIPTIRLIS